MAAKGGPELLLTGSTAGANALPTLEDLVQMFRKLTGREPTEEELIEARARYTAKRPPD